MKKYISFICITAMLLAMLVSAIPACAEPSAITASFEHTGEYAWSADGTLTINNASEKLPRHYVIKWGNENGPLENYTDLGTVSANNATTTFKLRENIIIPQGADRFIIFEKNGNYLSETYAEALLPEGVGGNYDIGEPIYKFNIMSDIHITIDDNVQSNKNFIKAMTEIMTTNSDVDGVFINGDIAEWGESAEYGNLHKIIENLEKQTGVKISDKMHYGLGNHDYYKTNTEYGDLGWPPPDDIDIPVSQRQQIFLNGTKNDSETVYFDGWVGGIHYIFLADEGEESDRREVWAQISDEQFEWFEEKLNEGYGDTPVFVFLHQGIYDTVAGTKKEHGWSGIESSAEFRLKNMLKNYPEVILFSGHSHWSMETEDTYVPASKILPAMFNTASMKNISVSNTSSGNGAQGYYVTFYKNMLIFSGRNFYKDKWISNAQFAIPWNYDLKRVEAPVIEKNEPTETEAPKTEAPTSVPTEPNEVTATEPANRGCKSSVGGTAVILAACTVFGIATLNKKKD